MAEVPLDPDEVGEADHVRRTTGDGDGLRVCQQILVRPDRLQVPEEIQRVLAIDLEGIGSAAQRQVQGPEGRGQALEVVGSGL